MRLTVIVPDRCIYVYGASRTVASLPAELKGVHAIQWYDDHGEIEYVDPKKPNKKTSDVALIQKLAELWKQGRAPDEEPKVVDPA